MNYFTGQRFVRCADLCKRNLRRNRLFGGVFFELIFGENLTQHAFVSHCLSNGCKFSARRKMRRGGGVVFGTIWRGCFGVKKMLGRLKMFAIVGETLDWETLD